MGSMIDIDGTYNFRDVGGLPTADGGLMRPGLVYRSASLDSVTGAGLAQLAELGLRTVIDIRSADELERNGRFPHEGTGIEWFHVVSSVGPPVGADPDVRRIMDSPDPMALIFPLLVERAGPMYAGALQLMAEADRQPVVFHCTSGKDRTGLLALFLQLIVGVPMEAALVEFERSLEALAAIRGAMAGRYPHMAGMPEATLERMATVDRAWVHAAFDAMGGIEAFGSWLDGIGVDDALRARLRNLLVS